MIKRIEKINAGEFNAVAPHPLQSFEWGQARTKTGLEVVRFGEYDLDETRHASSLQNVYTMTIHQIPYTPYRLGYIPRSVMPPDDLVLFLHDWAQKSNIVFIKFEPNVLNSTRYSLPATRSFQRSPHPLFPTWTQTIDLTKTEDELMAQMKQKTRYNIRLAEKKGVVVREESNEKGFETFMKLYFATTRRQHYFGHDKHYHEIVWNALRDSIAHILIAYGGDEPLAAYELFYFNKKFYYPYGGSSEKHRNLMAANLIMWEAIRLGKRLGAHTFDLWGSLPPDYDREASWSGFTKFKEGYGTEFVEFVGSYDLVVNPVFYTMYNGLNTLRNWYLKLRA